jgi:molecular chaperone IbpA
MFTYKNDIFSAKEFNQIVDDFFCPFIKSEESSFPPYNIKKNSDNTGFTIEMAIAGIKREDLAILLDKNILTIRHKRTDKDDKEVFIHKGIAKRDFEQRFLLGEYVQVEFADLQNGILVIQLKVIVPEDKKPKQIEIGSSSVKLDRCLLNE